MNEGWSEKEDLIYYIFSMEMLEEIRKLGENGNETLIIPLIASRDTDYPAAELNTKLNLEKIINYELTFQPGRDLRLYIWIKKDKALGKVCFYFSGAKVKVPLNQYFETTIEQFNNFLPN